MSVLVKTIVWHCAHFSIAIISVLRPTSCTLHCCCCCCCLQLQVLHRSESLLDFSQVLCLCEKSFLLPSRKRVRVWETKSCVGPSLHGVSGMSLLCKCCVVYCKTVALQMQHQHHGLRQLLGKIAFTYVGTQILYNAPLIDWRHHQPYLLMLQCLCQPALHGSHRCSRVCLPVVTEGCRGMRREIA